MYTTIMKVPLLLVNVVLYSGLTLALAPNLMRPVVVWHGLGDSYASPGMIQFAELIKKIHPGIFVHSVFIDEDVDKDRRAGFYGNVNEQIELVAEQLSGIPELQGGFDAIGFSQGGQFLRAYVERYNSPPIQNLITFGSQHMGISDIPACKPYDFLCQVARKAAKQGVYGGWAQENIVQAQYFRDPLNFDKYLSSNRFLPSINNEVFASRNSTYARNLSSLKHLVLVIFTEDKTVVPKESAWFGAEAIDEAPFKDQQKSFTPDSISQILPMRMQPIYLENWIGLKELDERKAIIFETCEGEHMQIGDCWKGLVSKFMGGNK